MLKVTCALIFRKNKLLVTQRGEKSSHPFRWEFPGGKIKTGETAEDCIRREIMEELEIQVEILESLKAITFDYGFRQIELIPFLCRIQSGDIKLNNHIALEWVNAAKLHAMNLAGADEKLLRQRRNKEILEKYFREKMDNSG